MHLINQYVLLINYFMNITVTLLSKISINNPTPNAIVISISLSCIISGSSKIHKDNATITSAINPTMTTLF